MKDEQFRDIWSDALTASDRAAFVSDWALSSIWEGSEDEEHPASRIEAIEKIWDAAHISIRDIRQHTGLSQAKFSTRFCIPLRTVEDWERGVRKCPDYLRLLLAQAAGAYNRDEAK